ncbi:putative spermidine/putrescine transport system permease protein [Amycolatopsis xylanica]|uniref:Putative spermidine/putrescine transport system permease protein n=1 Tax=Amycolatopsis xylanica TaxID=589385 RepID=A0A1H3NPJ1_9PSEU|nr:putative spermidine/putrescine transport system permease protein [Amycolatopsis xylanica]
MAPAAPTAVRAGVVRRVTTWVTAHLGLVPFLVYTGVFLGAPVVMVLLGAFQDNDGVFTTDNIASAFKDQFGRSFATSIELSVLTAVLGAVLGAVLAQAVLASKEDGLLRKFVSSASGVLANFGGVPLAFAFIATLGSIGIVTKALKGLGFDIYASGFNLFNFTGIAIVYVYFQIPLMVIVFTPALEGMREQWREAAANLGATKWQYWRHIAGPILLPPFLASMLLLFANAFSAYATAYALTSGVVPLVPIQIGSLVSGNVVADQQNLGKALGLGMIVVVALVMAIYNWMQRRASRWLG